MDIKRNGQTITFDTNPDQAQDADLVQTTPYLNTADLPIPVQNFRIAGRRVVASTGYLAQQAIRELDGATPDDYTPPSTYHPGRCFCGRFGGGHIPGLLAPIKGDRPCVGDRVKPHDASTCGACLAGALDYRPTIEAGQTWISNDHGTDHQVAGPGDELGTWAMWGPTGHLYVTTDARLYTAYTLDLDR